MFWFVLVCGWALTAAAVALVWVRGRPGRNLAAGLLMGVVAGLLWPITLWFAIGTYLYQRAGSRSSPSGATPQELDAQVHHAEALAKQAELEGMPSSADYWRAEVQRLDAQRRGAMTAARPASTAAIVLGCTVASLATLGAVAVAAPAGDPAPGSGTPGPTPVQPVPTVPTSRLVPATTPPRTAEATAAPDPTSSRGSRVPAGLVGHWRGPAVSSGRNYLVDITVSQGDWGDRVAEVVLDSSWDGRCTYDAFLQVSGAEYIEFSLKPIASDKSQCRSDTDTRRLEVPTDGSGKVNYSVNGDFRGALERYE